jgi:STE24 endopeptidase
VPQAYADTISLADHQKAADYTLAKARLSQIDIAVDAAVLLGWTLLGGLNALNQVLLGWMGPGMAQQMVLVLAFTLLGGIIGLPLSLMQTFGVEQRFGFNKTTPSLWLGDMVKGLVLGLALGAGLMFGLEMLDSGFRTGSQLELV